MPSMCSRVCTSCGKMFQARTADVNRGWAMFCSKSCKGYSARNRPVEKIKNPKKKNKNRRRPNRQNVFDLSAALAEKVYRMDNPISVEPLNSWEYDGPHDC